MEFDELDNIIDFNEFKNKNSNPDNPKQYEDNNFVIGQAYNISKNDPCPCGSGQKFKNCCAEVKPTKSSDYYYDKIMNIFKEQEESKEVNKRKKAYKIAQKADQEYPVDPLFSEVAGTLAVELGEFREAKNYFMKNYRIMKDQFSLNSIIYLFEALAVLKEFEKIEEIGEKFLDKFDDHTFYLFLSEAKFMLDKKREGYQYGQQAYEKSDKDIFILNTLIKIYIANNLYVKALNLLKNNFTRFPKLEQELKHPEDNALNIFKYTVETLFDISTEESYSEDKYKEYLNRLIKIFKNIDPERKIKEDEIKNIKKIIPNKSTFSHFMVSLFYSFENYEWISNNSNILFEKATSEKKDVLTQLIMNAEFLSGNYEKVLEYKDYIYSSRFLQKNDNNTFTALKNYFLSLYYLNEKAQIINFIEYLDGIFSQSTLYIIQDMISENDNMDIVNILEYLKRLDGLDVFDEIEIIHEQIRNMVNELRLIDYTEFNKKEREFLYKLLEEFEKFNTNHFIYHYTKWLIKKSKEESYEVNIKSILNKPNLYPTSLALNYFAAVKILGPEYVLKDNNSIKNQIPEKRIDFFETIAKIKLGEIKDLRKVFSKFPDWTDYIMDILYALLTDEELNNLFEYNQI